MLKRVVIASLIFALISTIFTVIVPESLEIFGGLGMLFGFATFIACVMFWLLRHVIKFVKTHTMFLKIIKITVLSGIGLLFTLVFIYLFIAQSHTIDGASMEPSILNGKQVFSNKLLYRFENPKRGDIIIFLAPPATQCPEGAGCDMIARIIAVPRDRIIINDTNVILNGQKLDEPYLKEQNSTLPGTFLGKEEKILGENEYIVMGDNRNKSSDSRSYGYVMRDLIKGKVK